MTIYQAPRIKKIDYIVCKDFFSEANRVLDSSDNEVLIFSSKKKSTAKKYFESITENFSEYFHEKFNSSLGDNVVKNIKNFNEDLFDFNVTSLDELDDKLKFANLHLFKRIQEFEKQDDKDVFINVILQPLYGSQYVFIRDKNNELNYFGYKKSLTPLKRIFSKFRLHF